MKIRLHDITSVYFENSHVDFEGKTENSEVCVRFLIENDTLKPYISAKKPVRYVRLRWNEKIEHGVKVLGEGELTKKLTVKAAVFSASAKEKIEAVGGKTEVV